MLARVLAYGRPIPVPWTPFSAPSLWKKSLKMFSLSCSGIISPLLWTAIVTDCWSSDRNNLVFIRPLPYFIAFESRLLMMENTESFAHIIYIGVSGISELIVMCCSAAICSNILSAFFTIAHMSSFTNDMLISLFSIFLMSRSWFVRLRSLSVFAWIIRRSFSFDELNAPDAMILSTGILIRVSGVLISWVMFVKKLIFAL